MNLIKIIIFLLIISVSSLTNAAPHLLLYFDVNKTLIASDKASDKSIEDVVNELLAERYSSYWDSFQNEKMTFDTYVKNVLVPNGNRSLRQSYTQQFVTYLRDHSHPLYPEVLQQYQKAMEALLVAPEGIFTSFYSLLDYLEANELPYTIILRSFGFEIFEVMDAIDRQRGGLFSYSGHFREGKLHPDNEEAIEGVIAIYNKLKQGGHAAIRDDWETWFSHHMAMEKAKPFYIDGEDGETLPIFFDDNIVETDTGYNIIAPMDATTGESLSIEALIERKQAVQVDTLEAILDPDYFIKRVLESKSAALLEHSSQSR